MRRFPLPSIGSVLASSGHGGAAVAPARPLFSAETLSSASPDTLQALSEVIAPQTGEQQPPAVPEPEPALSKFEKQLQQWQEVMLLVREQQKIATELRKRRRGVETELLASMEALDRVVHPVSADKSLMVVQSTQFQPITEQYLTDQLPKVVSDPALAREIQQFLLSQRTQKTRKQLKVGRPKR